LVGIISIITAFLSPFLMKASDKIVPALEEKEDVWRITKNVR
jgi:CPA2 family monovalent cation:H+ antiporter-2